MPYRRRVPASAVQQLANQSRRPLFESTPVVEEPNLWERLGGLGGVSAAATRALSGVASSMGGPVGAGISGGGEALAELLEGSLLDPEYSLGSKAARIGTESAIGAIPFGAVLKAGKPLASAFRGALYSGGGEVARELARGEETDPVSILGHTALGGGLTGGLARLLGKPVVPVKPSIPTAIGRLTKGGQVVKEAQVPIGANPPLAKEPVPNTVRDLIAQAVGRIKPSPAATTGAISDLDKGIETAGRVGLGIRQDVLDDLVGEAKALGQAERLLTTEQKAAQRATDAELAATELETALLGKVRGKPRVSRTVAVKTEGGTERVTTPYINPKKSKSQGAGIGSSRLAPEDVAPSAPPSPLAQALEPKPGALAEDPSELAQFFKTRVGATGKNYRMAKEAEAAGDIPTASLAREAHIREQEALKATGPVSAATPDATAGSWVDEQLDMIDQIKKAGGAETGMARQDLLHSIGLGVAGAAIGGAIDPFDDRLTSAITGGAIGAVVPQLIRKYAERVPESITPPDPGNPAAAVPPDVVATVQAASDPKTFAEMAKTVWEVAPHVVRANLLLSPNLFSNAVIAPWGAGVLTGLERWAAGDPRGLALLKEMTPAGFQSRIPMAWEEAKSRIAAAESGAGEFIGEAPTEVRKYVAYPGTIVTMGDINTRMAMLKAGFSEEEARAATLTKEPWSKWGKAVVNFQRSGPLGQMLLPFGKTLVNVMEEGSKAIPGVGEIVQAQRAAATGAIDPLKQRMAQQAIGGLVGAGAGVVGYNEPDDPLANRLVRGAVSNVGGPYSLLGTMGYAAGKALKQGKGARGAAKAVASTPFTEMPLPSTDIPAGYVNFLDKLLAGEARLSQPPAGAIPGIIIPTLQATGFMERPVVRRQVVARRSRQRREP